MRKQAKTKKSFTVFAKKSAIKSESKKISLRGWISAVPSPNK